MSVFVFACGSVRACVCIIKLCFCVRVCIYARVCLSVCLRERENERKREKCESHCVYTCAIRCMCVYRFVFFQVKANANCHAAIVHIT